MRAWTRQHRIVLLLVALAAALRVGLMIVYSPAIHQSWDVIRFARTSSWTPFFSDFWTPAGYATVLAGLRLISSHLVFTIAAQHVMGIGSGLLLAGSAKRLGVRTPWHVLAGVVVWFGGDYVVFEHTLMSETLFLFVICLMVYFCSRMVADEASRFTWVLLAETAAVGATLVRWNALFLLPAPLVLYVVSNRGSLRRQWRRVAAIAVVPLLLMMGYVAVSSSRGYTGIGDMNGWHLYSRVSPFLDCARTTADDAYPEVCDNRPSADRPGPYYYEWDPTSPAHAAYGIDPARSGELFDVGLDAVRRQPLDYAKAVGTDLIRLFDWSYDATAGHGQAISYYQVGYRDQAVEQFIADAIAQRYEGTHVVVRSGVGAYDRYQSIVRVRGWMMLIMLAASLLGLVRLRRRLPWGAVFTLYVMVGIWTLPILTFTWDYRYALPGTAFGPLTVLIVSAHLMRISPAGEQTELTIAEPPPVERARHTESPPPISVS